MRNNKITRRTNKKFITLQEARHNKKIIAMGYNIVKNKVNVLIGLSLIGYGLSTVLLPTGSIVLIGIGLTIFGCPISINNIVGNWVIDIKLWLEFL